MLKFLRIFKKDYQTLNRIEISKINLLKNYKYLSSLKVKIAPVIKSNAYGHGIVNIAKILDSQGAPFFCVDSLYEGYKLLKAKIKTPILIMGYTDPENFKVKKLPFTFAVFDLETAGALNKFQSNCSIHIFVDTGMHREGISLSELPEFLNQLQQFSKLKVEGLMSHLASADNPKDPLNKTQIKNFKKTIDTCKKHGIKPKWIHLQNSDGLNLNLKDCGLNMARAGLALYGISNNSNLKPALKLVSKLIQIKEVKKGESIGYDGTYKTKQDTIIGVLPIGFYDGVDRGLSNKGVVKIENTYCPIVGRVSMNLTTIDLSKLHNPKLGQEVLVYSDNPEDKNSIQNVAQICKKIPYEILVNLAQSTRRIIT